MDYQKFFDSEIKTLDIDFNDPQIHVSYKLYECPDGINDRLCMYRYNLDNDKNIIFQSKFPIHYYIDEIINMTESFGPIPPESRTYNKIRNLFSLVKECRDSKEYKLGIHGITTTFNSENNSVHVENGYTM